MCMSVIEKEWVNQVQKKDREILKCQHEVETQI